MLQVDGGMERAPRHEGQQGGDERVPRNGTPEPAHSDEDGNNSQGQRHLTDEDHLQLGEVKVGKAAIEEEVAREQDAEDVAVGSVQAYVEWCASPGEPIRSRRRQRSLLRRSCAAPGVWCRHRCITVSSRTPSPPRTAVGNADEATAREVPAPRPGPYIHPGVA